MFIADSDLALHITRGDAGAVDVRAVVQNDDGTEEPYVFKAGEVLRLKVVEKKNYSNVILQKDFSVYEDSETVLLELLEHETKIGDTISKPVDYWYEIELNPFTEPQTIVGYDEDGAKLFRLYPEGLDKEIIPPTPEELGPVDKELSLTSEHAIQNQAVTRAIVENKSAISNVSRVKEFNQGVKLGFWVGAQAEYDAMEDKNNNTFCIIVDEDEKEVLSQQVKLLQNQVKDIEEKLEDDFKYKINESDYLSVDYVNENSRIILPGHLSNSKRKITFSFMVDKSLEDVTDIEVETLKANIRHVAGGFIGSTEYVEGGTDFSQTTSGYYYTSAIKANNHYVTIEISMPNAFDGVANNTPLEVEINSLKLRLENRG